MCGINGFIKRNNTTGKFPYDEIGEMNSLIEHRGPDDEGVYTEVSQGHIVAMGMRRLAIIDLAGGNQPVYSADGNVVIVFNGEIYNYRNLRQELETYGIQFKSNSDTEVILQIYLKYGKDGFTKLDGMFAFSIYDKTCAKIFIGRDYFGFVMLCTCT